MKWKTRSLAMAFAVVLLCGLLGLGGCGRPDPEGGQDQGKDTVEEQAMQKDREEKAEQENPESRGPSGSKEPDGGADTGTETEGRSTGSGEISDSGGTGAGGASSSADSGAAKTGTDGSVSEGEGTCTVSISCSTLTGNGDLASEKQSLVPGDGWILKSETVCFSEGDSVFDVLQSACMNRKLHMEYAGTASAKTIYIEGIGNLYELDAGPLSGWMYKVDGKFPNFGSSKYTVKNGDAICWAYTCDLGKDIGAGSTGWQR